MVSEHRYSEDQQIAPLQILETEVVGELLEVNLVVVGLA